MLDQKLSFEKIKSWGESRYFDFRKSLRKASSSTRKRDYYIISFITDFLLLKNDQEIRKKFSETSCWDQFPFSQVWSHSFVGFV